MVIENISPSYFSSAYCQKLTTEHTEFFSVPSLPAARSTYGRNEADGRQAGVVSCLALFFHKTFDTTQLWKFFFQQQNRFLFASPFLQKIRDFRLIIPDRTLKWCFTQTISGIDV